jgi:hypothetical protein
MVRRVCVLLVAVALAAACGNDDATGTSPAPDATGATDETDEQSEHDTEVRLNDIQALGTHNSYKQRVPEELSELLAAFDEALAASMDYEHAPLTEQFEDQGARQIELDVFADPEGGRYATRNANELAGLPTEADEPELSEPGFKVLHVQEVDYASSCPTLVRCLTEVRDWSEERPDHLPILILVEVKDEEIPDPVGTFVQPVSIEASHLDELDDEIRSVFDDDHVITPDDIRGDAETLREVIVGDGWPTLAEARGKVLFALDNTGDVLDLYVDGHPTLEDRMMFASVDPDDPAAAFAKLNDPIADGDRIAELVEAGFVIRTRADADTVQARTGDTTMREAALDSGAQYISTDYLEPDEQLGDYFVEMPDGGTVRCNPVRQPDACDDDLLEG